MTVFTLFALSLAAGLHGALYGAYKDSPHEGFRLRRFVRELAFALAVSMAMLAVSPATLGQSAFVLYLSVFALTRTATEFWKLFVREEPQEGFRIPTQMHIVTSVLHNRGMRLLFGIGFLASIYGLWGLFTLIPSSWPTWLRGLLIGVGIGTAEAIAGAYKDGTVEGFYWRKFFKSPAFGAIGGLIAAGHTANVGFLLLAAIGTMRMFLELLFKMLPSDYVPGKFRSLVGPFPEWLSWRRRFVVPYALTWLLYLVLCSHSSW